MFWVDFQKNVLPEISTEIFESKIQFLATKHENILLNSTTIYWRKFEEFPDLSSLISFNHYLVDNSVTINHKQFDLLVTIKDGKILEEIKFYNVKKRKGEGEKICIA